MSVNNNRPEPFIGMRFYLKAYPAWATLVDDPKTYPKPISWEPYYFQVEGESNVSIVATDQFYDLPILLPGEPYCPIDPKGRKFEEWKPGDKFWHIMHNHGQPSPYAYLFYEFKIKLIDSAGHFVCEKLKENLKTTFANLSLAIYIP